MAEWTGSMEDLGINRIGQKTIWCKINLLEELFRVQQAVITVQIMYMMKKVKAITAM